MALERCPACGDAPQSCQPIDPVPQVIPDLFEYRCNCGHSWAVRVGETRWTAKSHLYDCTHDPCRCPTPHDLLEVFSADELLSEIRAREGTKMNRQIDAAIAVPCKELEAILDALGQGIDLPGDVVVAIERVRGRFPADWKAMSDPADKPWNRVVLGDGRDALLLPALACINRIREPDGHLSCNHGDETACDRTGHETISTYEVVTEGDPRWWSGVEQ